MAPRVRRRGLRAGSDPLGLVGWVFADLLLGLMLVFLGTQPGDPSAGAPPPTTTSTTLPPTTTTTMAPPPTVPVGVDRQYLCVRIPTVPDVLLGAPGPGRDRHADALAVALHNELVRMQASARRAGIVLSFGTGSNPSDGKAIAQAFNDLVLPRVPAVFENSAARAFWDGGPRANIGRGSVAVNLYPITGADTQLLPPAAPC